MSDSKYRNIQRSKPENPILRRGNSIIGMAFRLDRFFRRKRQLYIGGGIFVLLGALPVGYFGSLTRDNIEEVIISALSKQRRIKKL